MCLCGLHKDQGQDGDGRGGGGGEQHGDPLLWLDLCNHQGGADQQHHEHDSDHFVTILETDADIMKISKYI